jgi:hypothetical protein
VRYLRLPRDESHRLLSGALYQAILAGGNALMGADDNGAMPAPGAGASNVLAFGGGQVPGANPLITLGRGWWNYLEGENPKDSFRNSPVLTNDQWLAGGWPALKGMIGFSAEQSGITNFVRWNADADTTTEMIFSAIPGVNRLTGVTDAGYREQQMMRQREENAKGARMRVQLGDSTLYLLRQHNTLSRVKPELRTEEQAQRLEAMRAWKHAYDTSMDRWGAEPDRPIPKSERDDLERTSREYQEALR